MARVEPSNQKWYILIHEPKEYVVIEGAGHTFDEDGIEEKLFEETVSWISSNS